MAEVFTWVPDDGPGGQIDVRAGTLQFGDGYRQVIGDGLNTIEQTWPLSFNRAYTEIGAIATFLRARALVPESFLWTPPGPDAAQGFYICLSWRVTPRSGQNAILTATFEQVFFP